MADEPEVLTNVVSYMLGDERFDIDLYDINGEEWRYMRLVSGLSRNDIAVVGVASFDFEAVAALVMTWKRREDPTVEYVDVLRSIDMRSTIAVLPEEAEADPPD